MTIIMMMITIIIIIILMWMLWMCIDCLSMAKELLAKSWLASRASSLPLQRLWFSILIYMDIYVYMWVCMCKDIECFTQPPSSSQIIEIMECGLGFLGKYFGQRQHMTMKWKRPSHHTPSVSLIHYHHPCLFPRFSARRWVEWLSLELWL